MNKESKNNVRLGLFIIIAFALFTIGVYNIGSRNNVFRSVINISAVFDNAQGLQPGNVVRYAGINVGSVDEIVIVNDSTVRVDMRLKSSVKQYMKKDAQAYISSDGLVGDKVINILPSKKGMDEMIVSGDIINTLDRVETDDLVASLDRTNQNILLISENLLIITDQMANGEGVAANLISNKRLSDDLAATLYHLKTMSAALSRTSSEMEMAINEVNEGKGIMGYLLKDSSFSESITQLFAEIDTQFIHKTEPILANIDASSMHVKSMSATLDSLLNEIDLEKGMLGLFLKDTVAAEQTNIVIDEAVIGVEMFNENMKALKHNFLFRRYFKRKAKKERKALERAKKEAQNESVSTN